MTNYVNPGTASGENLFLYIFWFFVIIIAYKIIREAMTKSKIKELKEYSIKVTPEEFFKLRNQKKAFNSKKNISTDMDFAGIYIIYNNTKDMYYVGQSKNVMKRVNNHLTGKGNGDVYADYKYGDSFTISLIALKGSGFATLNDLERNAIKTYNAYAKGYNKTRGNK